MHVLILCNDFPPLNSVAAQRPESWARYLPDEGIRTTVVARDWSDEPRFLAAPGSLDEGAGDPGGAAVIRVRQRRVPSRLLAERLGPALSGLRRALTFVEHASAFSSFGLDRHANLYHAVRGLLARGGVDVLLTTAEPFVFFRYGALLKRAFGVRWVADYRDGWRHSHVGQFDRRLPARLLRSWEGLFERRLIRPADRVTTVDPELARELSAYHQRPVTTVYNGFWDFHGGPLPARPALPLVLTHSGTLTDGQQVELLLDAVRDLVSEGLLSIADIRLEFLGLEASPRQAARVKARLGAAATCLITTVRLPREEALVRCASADLLVSLTDPRVHAIYAKTYEYLAARRPILVIPDDRSILSELVRTTRAGMAFAGADDLKAFLVRSVAEKRGSGRLAAQDLDESYARAFTRREQARGLAKLLREVAGG